jgi:lipopolysaccharide transport system permease protein
MSSMKTLTDVPPAPAAESAPHDWQREFDLVLEPTRGVAAVRVHDLWQFRELLYFLSLRDIKVRYKQTALGVVWAVLQPVLAMVLFTVVFGHVAKISTGDIPYPIFAYSALVPWFFFANSVQLSSTSLIVNPQLITKVYFPRVYLVMSPIVASVVDFLLSFAVLIGMMVYYGVTPDPLGTVLLLPLFVLAFLLTTGICAWLSALNVKYRDVRFVVPFLVQVWLFATPVVYSIASVGEPWQSLYALNPMVAVVEGFRWALAGGAPLTAQTAIISTASGLCLLALGLLYFHRTEKTFADVI